MFNDAASTNWEWKQNMPNKHNFTNQSIKQLHEVADSFSTKIGQLKARRCRPKGVCFEVPRQSGRGKHDLNKELLFILPHPEHTRWSF